MFYDGLTPEGYDEWAIRVNFSEPYHIVSEVERLTKDVTSGVTSTARVFDIGAGTGLLGMKLKERGLNLDIIAVDSCK